MATEQADPFRRGGRSLFTTVSLGCNCAQNPCMVPSLQQRPMFYSTNQKSSAAIFIGKPIPTPDRVLSRDKRGIFIVCRFGCGCPSGGRRYAPQKRH